MSDTPNSDMYNTVPKAVVVELEKQLATVAKENQQLIEALESVLLIFKGKGKYLHAKEQLSVKSAYAIINEMKEAR